MANAKEIHALVFLAHPEDVSMVSVLKIHARTLTVHLVYAEMDNVYHQTLAKENPAQKGKDVLMDNASIFALKRYVFMDHAKMDNVHLTLVWENPAQKGKHALMDNVSIFALERYVFMGHAKMEDAHLIHAWEKSVQEKNV